MADLFLDRLSSSEDNARAGWLVDSEKVETEPGTLILKEVDSEKAKPGSGTCPEKVMDSEKVKAGPRTLTDAKAVGVSRMVVNLARVGPGMVKAGPGESVNKEAKKKGEVIAAAKREKHRCKTQAKKKQGESVGKEGDAGKVADPLTPVTPQEKTNTGSRPVAKARNQDAGELADRGLDHSTQASKKRPSETPSPATGLERVPPKKGMVESYASILESSELRVAIF